nr:MAG TPA: hypothetical protein [Caudoviricetes sp.]
MLVWMQTVTDRSQSDADRVLELLQKEWNNFNVDEKKEWIAGMKGALNRSDMQRIQNNTKLLSDVLELNLTVADVPEHPNETFLSSIITNTEIIRNAYVIHTDTPETPSMPVNTYQKLNDIEKILDDVYGILLNNFHYYCGTEVYAGEETGMIL